VSNREKAKEKIQTQPDLISERPMGQHSILRAALLERLSLQNVRKRHKTNVEAIAQE
jgi:hypothetical protein